MRPAPLSCLLLTCLTINISRGAAQAPGVELQAGLGYARVFDAGGVSFAAVVDRPVSSPANPMQHALGLSFWYAHTKVASDQPESSLRRDLVGLGIRYQLGTRKCCGPVHPFFAIPVQVLRSSVEDAAQLQASVHALRIPEPPVTPEQDLSGGAWGWGAGLELGVRVGLGENLDLHSSIQGLYQDIYTNASQNGAWNWHAGFTYRLGRS